LHAPQSIAIPSAPPPPERARLQLAVLCTLLPLQRGGSLAAAPPAVGDFLKRAEGALPVAPSLAAVLAGGPEAALVDTFKADAAAHAAAAPKRPLPGKRNVLVRRRGARDEWGPAAAGLCAALPFALRLPFLCSGIGAPQFDEPGQQQAALFAR
jgi:hypothetical protein